MCQETPACQSHTCEIVEWDSYGSPDPKSMAKQTTEPNEKNEDETEQWAALLPQKNAFCAMCLYTAMQAGKTKENSNIQKALDESQRRYLELGYKEMEKLTHESYALSFLACSA